MMVYMLYVRYENSEPLREEDEKTVVEKLLHFHPNREEKIGSGNQAIMVSSLQLLLISGPILFVLL